MQNALSGELALSLAWSCCFVCRRVGEQLSVNCHSAEFDSKQLIGSCLIQF